MVKKLKADGRQEEAPSAAGLFDSALAGSVKDSAQQIWLAGMGAFAKAQAEGGKVFDALVKEGVTLQKKTQSVAEEKLGEVTEQDERAWPSDVTAKAGKHWDKLESIFEERTAKALKQARRAARRRTCEALMARDRRAVGAGRQARAKPAAQEDRARAAQREDGRRRRPPPSAPRARSAA